MSLPTVSFDPAANALYIRFTDNAIEETVALSDSVYVDVDERGDPVGFEILHAAAAGLDTIPTLPDSTTLRKLLKASAA